MLNNIGLNMFGSGLPHMQDITNKYKPQLNASPSKNWMADIGKISNTPKLPMTKSTDSLWGGLKAGASKFMGKAGDEIKWLNQDLTSGLTDLAGKAGAGIGAGVGGMMDMAAGVVDSVAGAVGLKGAEVTTGMDNALDIASSLPLEYIPGVGTILKGGLKALSLVNKYAGASSHKQGTDLDMGIMGYNTDINENAGKKYSLFGRSARKKTNILTDSYDRQNLSKYASSQFQKQNAMASQNTTASIDDRNRMQLMGGYGTNILAARMGTKIPPVNLRKIVNKAYYNFEQKHKFRDPILGQKGSKTLPPPSKRTSVRKNEDGTESTHLYASGESDGKFVAYPTIYQNDKGEYYEAENAFEEAIKKGEIIEFDTDEEAKAYAEGAWKNHYNYDGTPKKYKDGGLLTKADKKEVIEEVVEEKMNVIPEGAFHSRKNNIHEDVAEHVTKKGIPVITKDEEGKVTQHAEVERNEIIFHKEATDTMETLYEKFKKADTQKLKDEIMIECGKYVADQILVNTDDRTGMIDTIEYA